MQSVVLFLLLPMHACSFLVVNVPLKQHRQILLSKVVRGLLSELLLPSPPDELRLLVLLLMLMLLDIRSNLIVEFRLERCGLLNGVFFFGTLGCRDAFCSAPAWADSSKVGSTWTLQLPFRMIYMQSPSSPARKPCHMPVPITVERTEQAMGAFVPRVRKSTYIRGCSCRGWLLLGCTWSVACACVHS